MFGQKRKMESRFGMGMVVLLLLSLGISAQAAENDSGSVNEVDTKNLKRVLTLQDCVDIAREKNPEMKVFSLVKEMADRDVKISVGAFMPTVSGNASYTRLSDTAALPVVPGSLLFTEVGSKNNFLVGMTAIQPVYDGTLFASHKLAKRQRDVAEMQQERTDKKSVANVKKAFYRALFFKEISSAQKNFRDSTSQELTRVQSQHRRGTASGLQLAQAEGIEAATRTSYEDTLANYEKSKDELKRLIGYPIDFEIILEGDLDDYTRGSGESSPAPTEEGDPDVRLAQAQYQMARAATGKKLSEFYPKIYGHFNLYGTKPNLLVEPDTDLTLNYWTGAALHIPIFDGLRNYHEYKKAKAQEKIALVLKEQAEEQSRIKQRDQRRRPPEETIQLEGPRKRYEAARKSYEVAEVAHNNRMISGGRWVEAQRAWGKAQMEWAQEQLKFLSQRADQ